MNLDQTFSARTESFKPLRVVRRACFFHRDLGPQRSHIRRLTGMNAPFDGVDSGWPDRSQDGAPPSAVVAGHMPWSIGQVSALEAGERRRELKKEEKQRGRRIRPYGPRPKNNGQPDGGNFRITMKASELPSIPTPRRDSCVHSDPKGNEMGPRTVAGTPPDRSSRRQTVTVRSSRL